MDNPEFASISILSDPHLELSPNLISPISSPEHFSFPLPPDSPPELPPLLPLEDFPLHDQFEELLIEDDQNKEAEEKKRKGKEGARQ
ncbi:uncharacterized protein G2W53_022336 [Senna tora]|uniref:Uncharacterized protein n=1 Tax=Senna tora TaxID=362788 RepID=A0A834TMH7_9FABA|nr:uncharacterized protein G2W53_022336 [Senna tora]